MPPGARRRRRRAASRCCSAPRSTRCTIARQLMTMQRMIGQVPHLTRQMQERMARRRRRPAAGRRSGETCDRDGDRHGGGRDRRLSRARTPPPISHEYADVNGVRLHYARAGTGPLIVFLHGFPEFWYEWKNQLAEFSRDHTVVAPDMRGYNLSSKPAELSAYQMPKLVEDVRALASRTDEVERRDEIHARRARLGRRRRVGLRRAAPRDARQAGHRQRAASDRLREAAARRMPASSRRASTC